MTNQRNSEKPAKQNSIFSDLGIDFGGIPLGDVLKIMQEVNKGGGFTPLSNVLKDATALIQALGSMSEEDKEAIVALVAQGSNHD